ncbi:MAG: hypothetical protein JXA90_12130 [Planctomycetes bacterium]|nr:hypothetical protein [Planctomycetota bacterium]
MPPTTGTNEEIIEKRDLSPFATSCIVIAVVAVFAAIILQLKEISALNPRDVDKIARGMYAREVEQDVREQKTLVDDALRKADASPQILSRIEDVLGEPVQLPEERTVEEGEEEAVTPTEEEEGVPPVIDAEPLPAIDEEPSALPEPDADDESMNLDLEGEDDGA